MLKMVKALNKKSILEIWSNTKMLEYRNKLSTGDRSLSPCSNCNANGKIFGHNHAKAWSSI